MIQQKDYKGNPRTPEKQERLEREAKRLNKIQAVGFSPETRKYLTTWTADKVEKAENDIWN